MTGASTIVGIATLVLLIILAWNIKQGFVGIDKRLKQIVQLLEKEAGD